MSAFCYNTEEVRKQRSAFIMSDSREKTMRLTRIALLIAMNCISAYLIIPLPFSQSPIALQTLVVNLVAFLLPPKDAAITMLAYIGIGIIGVPVFTGGTAGPGKMFGPTGGYIWAYVAAVFLMSWFKGKQYSFRRYSLVAVAIGIPVIYLGGVLQLKGITGMPGKQHHERRRSLHPPGYRQEPLRRSPGTAAIGLRLKRDSGLTPAVNPLFVGIHLPVYLKDDVVDIDDRCMAYDTA